MSYSRHNPKSELMNNTCRSSDFSIEPLRVRVAATLQEVEELRPVWQQWANGLHTDFEHCLQNLKNDSTAIGPYVMSVWQGEIPLGILVGQIKERKASTTISMVQVNGPRVRVLEILPKGRLGPASEEVDRLFAGQIAEALRKSRVELAYFHRLPADSSLYKSVWNLSGLLTRKRIAYVFSYSVVCLTSEPGMRPPVFSGKIMREARRKVANLNREFNGRVGFRCYSQVEELSDALNEAEKIKEGTWQNALGSDFTDPLQTTDSFRFFAAKGWLRMFVLSVADRPAAFLIGLLHDKTFHCQHAGYHADFAKHSVGSILTNWAFEHLAASGVEQVDLGEGGQEHNRRLGCEKNQENTVHVYAPTLRGLYLSMFFGLAQGSRAIGSWLRTRLHLEWAGRRWREFLLARRPKMRPKEIANRFPTANPSGSFGIAARHPDTGTCE